MLGDSTRSVGVAGWRKALAMKYGFVARSPELESLRWDFEQCLADIESASSRVAIATKGKSSLWHQFPHILGMLRSSDGVCWKAAGGYFCPTDGGIRFWF